MGAEIFAGSTSTPANPDWFSARVDSGTSLAVDRFKRCIVDFFEHRATHPRAVEHQRFVLVPGKIPGRTDACGTGRTDTGNCNNIPVFRGFLNHQPAQTMADEHGGFADPVQNGGYILDIVFDTRPAVFIRTERARAFMIADRQRVGRHTERRKPGQPSCIGPPAMKGTMNHQHRTIEGAVIQRDGLFDMQA